MIRRLIFILAGIWWLGTMYLIYAGTKKSQPATMPELDIVVVGKLDKQEWYSIYWRGEKVGYSTKGLQRTGKKIMVTDVSYLRLPIGGIVQEIYALGITVLDTNFAMESFSFDIQGGDYEATAEGKVGKNELLIIVGTSESKDTMLFPLTGDIYSPTMLPEMFVSSQKIGDTIREINTFDPFTLTEAQYSIVSIRKSHRKVMGKEKEAWVLSISAMGLLSEMWISNDGELLYEKGPGGFEQFRESQKSALSFELSASGNIDILTDFAIPARWRQKISPRDAQYAVYNLQDFPVQILELNDYNQQLRHDTLFVYSNGFSSGEPPSPSDTAEVPFIQCHDLRIVRAAKKIIAGESDTLRMLEKINKYLFENIKKEYQTSIPSALDVLSKMRGDCNEHSTLFVALARALGIPTRINVGVVYREDGFFLYHAWAQSYTHGRWYTFDPTYGQTPVDATHIKLLSGNLEKQIQLLRLGQVSISILEAGEKCPL